MSRLKDSSPFSKYVSDNSLREHAVLAELRDHTMKNVKRWRMLTDPVEAQFLSMLVKLVNAKKCLEVGTFTGYNALNCALAMPADGVVHALDISEEYVQHGYPFFEKANVKEKIKVHIGPAVESMDGFIKDGQTETFDFIYIDADKLGYWNYIERAYLLARIGGVIVVDNTLQKGRVADLTQEMDAERRAAAEFIHKVNQKLKTDSRFQLSFLDIADGVTVLRKRREDERKEYN